MKWQVGDRVEYFTASQRHPGQQHRFYGVIEGFVSKDIAMCTDQTGLGSRPVRVGRLRRPTVWYRGETVSGCIIPGPEET